MKGAGYRNHVATAGCLACQLDGSVVGLSSTVGKEEAPGLLRQDCAQCLQQTGAHGRIRETGIGVLHQFPGLFHNRAYQRGMGVPKAGDAPARGEIQIAFTLLIPDMATLATLESQGLPVAYNQTQLILGCNRFHRLLRSENKAQKKTSRVRDAWR